MWSKTFLLLFTSSFCSCLHLRGTVQTIFIQRYVSWTWPSLWLKHTFTTILHYLTSFIYYQHAANLYHLVCIHALILVEIDNIYQLIYMYLWIFPHKFENHSFNSTLKECGACIFILFLKREVNGALPHALSKLFTQ